MSVRIVSATPAFRCSPDHLHTPALAPVATTSSRSTSKCNGVAVWRKDDTLDGRCSLLASLVLHNRVGKLLLRNNLGERGRLGDSPGRRLC
jgi:hypothetical protein